MGKGNRQQRRKSRTVTVDLAELRVIVAATRQRPLTADEHQKLEQGRELLEDLVLPYSLPNEKTAAVLADDKGKKEQAASKPKAPGHGRRPREDFRSAATVRVSRPLRLPHPALAQRGGPDSESDGLVTLELPCSSSGAEEGPSEGPYASRDVLCTRRYRLMSAS